MLSSLLLLKLGVTSGRSLLGLFGGGVPNTPFVPFCCCFGGALGGPFRVLGASARKTSGSDSSEFDEGYICGNGGLVGVPPYEDRCFRPESSDSVVELGRCDCVGELRMLLDRPMPSSRIDVRSPAAVDEYGVRTRLPSA